MDPHSMSIGAFGKNRTLGSSMGGAAVSLPGLYSTPQKQTAKSIFSQQRLNGNMTEMKGTMNEASSASLARRRMLMSHADPLHETASTGDQNKLRVSELLK